MYSSLLLFGGVWCGRVLSVCNHLTWPTGWSLCTFRTGCVHPPGRQVTVSGMSQYTPPPTHPPAPPRARVCTGSWPWEKNLVAPSTRTPRQYCAWLFSHRSTNWVVPAWNMRLFHPALATYARCSVPGKQPALTRRFHKLIPVNLGPEWLSNGGKRKMFYGYYEIFKEVMRC